MDEIIAALDNGDRARAFALLKEHLRRNPRDADGWLAMADAAPAPAMQLDSLRRALRLAPGHDRADEIRGRIAAMEAPDAPTPVTAPDVESSVAAAMAPPEPTPISAGEAAALSDALDEPHPDTVTAAAVASESVERSYAGELEELDAPVATTERVERSYAGELEELDGPVATAESVERAYEADMAGEYEEESEGGSGSSLWMLLVLAGALMFCVGIYLLLGDLAR